MSNPAEDSWLTIAEAAARLGISGPRLRRLLTRPGFAERIQKQSHETVTGTRSATMIPLALLLDLKTASASYRAREKQVHKENNSNDNHSDNVADNVSMTVPMGAAFAAALSAKDEVIMELRAALAHEREQAVRLTETIGRQQLLLSMTGPQDSPSEATKGPHSGATDKDGSVVKRVGLWRWITGRLKSRD